MADTTHFTGDFEGGPLQVLDGFFARAAVRGERAVVWIRLVLCVVGWGQMMLLDGAVMMAQGHPKPMVVTAGLLLGAVHSIATLLFVHKFRVWLLALSVLVDTVVIAVIVFPLLWWADLTTFEGLPTLPEFYFFLIAALAAGIRLSRKVTILSAILNFTVCLALMVVDLVHNGETVLYAPDNLTVWMMLYFAAVAFSIALASRTRKLVIEGAEASISAERARHSLGTYVSHEVAHEILSSDGPKMGGTRQTVVVLFSDLRGFTSYSENLDPEQLVQELNAYLDQMVRVLKAEGAYVDKFIGDAIMAVFGVPEPRDDDPVRAVRAALEMDTALKRHNAHRKLAGSPPLEQGIAVHIGPVVAGNIGNQDKLQYTVIGDTVNLASRLESATKEHGVSLLLSEDLVEAVRAAGGKDVLLGLASMGTITVRGREQETAIYTLR